MNYFDSDSTKYPVLCITGGDWLFAPAADYAYWLWRLKTKIIVVGIAGPEPGKRGLDFNTSSNGNGVIGAERFLTFMQGELFPRLEKHTPG